MSQLRKLFLGLMVCMAVWLVQPLQADYVHKCSAPTAPTSYWDKEFEAFALVLWVIRTEGKTQSVARMLVEVKQCRAKANAPMNFRTILFYV